MTNETVSADSVHVAGAFQGWDPAKTQMTHVGNNIYRVTLEVDAGTYEYKFVNGNAWGGDESVPGACNTNGNRTVTIGASDMTVSVVCFKQCGHPCITDPDPADITFQVDMANESVDTSGVWIMGTITSPQWQSGAVEMTDGDGDGVYEATINVSGAAEIQYKFSNGDPKIAAYQNGELANFDSLGCGISNGLGAYNRVHTRTGTAETLAIVSYDACSRLTSISKVGIGQYMTMYPNPANETVFVKYGSANNFRVSVLDLSGRLVMEGAETNALAELNISGLKSGAYIVVIYDVELNQSAYQKLIVE